MKLQFAAIAAALAIALAGSSAVAEPKGQKGKAAAGPQVRYFDLSQDIFSELNSEVILKETRQGTTVVSAELDICHLSSPTSNRFDRAVVPLKFENGRLVGTAQSQEKQAVSVNLVRRFAGGNFTFEGTVNSGSNSEKVKSADNAEMSEEQIADQFSAETQIESAPADFTAVWAQSLIARIGRAGLLAFLDAMRDQNVRMTFNGLVTSCGVLRSGHHTVQIDVEAERAGAVLAKIKSIPGVTAAGFPATTPNMQRAIRFPSAGWRDAAGRLDRDKFAAAVGAAMAKVMSATVSATSWNNLMGELTVEMKRPEESIAGLKLTEVVTVTAIVAPESLSSNQQSILWIEAITARIADERPAPRLEFSQSQPENGEQSNDPDGSDDLPDGLAAALKGQTWDSDNDRWQR